MKTWLGWTGLTKQSRMEGRKRRSESERRSRGSERGRVPPVFDLPDIKRNKDLSRLKADLEERARARPDQRRGPRPRVEVLYIDATRNVGVVLGEKNVGANMKKQDKR